MLELEQNAILTKSTILMLICFHATNAPKTKLNFICMIKEATSTNFALPVLEKESQEKISNIPKTHPGSLTFDNLGQLDLSMPYSGPAHVFVQLSKYDGTTVVSSISDIHKVIFSFKDLKKKTI